MAAASTSSYKHPGHNPRLAVAAPTSSRVNYATLEIRWHEQGPIYSCDVQPYQADSHRKQLNPYQKNLAENASEGDGRLLRLATAGGDNKVRIWLAIPEPPVAAASTSNGIPAVNGATSASSIPRGKPKVEYLATLDKHTMTVNVIRFSPRGDILATAGDDAAGSGIFLWRYAGGPPTVPFGSSRSDELAYERESWTNYKVIKTSCGEIYDLTWSPCGSYILAGGTDSIARIYRVADGHCIAEMNDHTNWVQGVAWDPLNKFIATQGKDRSMNVYSIDPEKPNLGPKLVSRNTKLVTEKEVKKERSVSPTVSTSPTVAKTAAPTAPTMHSQLMFGDDESTPFFRRLAFSPDGAFLVTPAGIFEDPSSSTYKKSKKASADDSVSSKPESSKGSSSKPKKEVSSTTGGVISGPASPTVYLFARGQLANESPVAYLPGHKTTSIVVKFNPVLWQLRERKKDSKGKGKATALPNGVSDGEDGMAMQVDGESRQEPQPVKSEEENGMQVDGEVPSESTSNERESMFSLPYRSIYAVATHETVLIYDTQQPSPLCFFGSLHFAPFTDLAWSFDGLTLIATSSDGYVTIFSFLQEELGVPYEHQPVRAVTAGTDDLASANAKPGTPNILSPVKAVDPAPSTSGPPQKAGLKKEDSDVILLEGPPPATASSTVAPSSSNGSKAEGADQPEKKVKKRAVLTTVPLGTKP